MNCLMMNIHYGNEDVRNVCVKILGEFGALNPARYGCGLTNGKYEARCRFKIDTFLNYSFLYVIYSHRDDYNEPPN